MPGGTLLNASQHRAVLLKSDRVLCDLTREECAHCMQSTAFPIASPAAAASPRPLAGRGRQRFARKSLPGEGAATALGLGGLVYDPASFVRISPARNSPAFLGCPGGRF